MGHIKRMKIFTISLISLLVGIGVGWHFGHTIPAAQVAKKSVLKTDDYWHNPLAPAEFSTAALATETIGYIDSGDTQRAIKHLSVSIAHYYAEFAYHPSTNEDLLKLRDRIDQLAQTNQVVAACIGTEIK
jgi:hypothetical protein